MKRPKVGRRTDGLKMPQHPLQTELLFPTGVGAGDGWVCGDTTYRPYSSGEEAIPVVCSAYV